MSETKAEKFERLRDARLTKVLDAMRILGHLTNARDYEYTSEQAADIIAQLRAATDTLELDFGLDPAVTEPAANLPEGEVEEDSSEATVLESAVEQSADDPDPSGPKSRVTSHAGKKLKVAPGEWKSIDLLRVGPHLGLAFEAVMDGKNDDALDYLKKVMTA